MTEQADLLILGGGTGGYVAAIRAAQKGLDVVLVEKDKLGGTCLHRGCIPTKALLKSAEIADTLRVANDFGIETAETSTINFVKVNQRKQAIIDQLHKGVQSLVLKNKIRVINGTGVVMGPSIFSPVSGAVIVTKEDGEEEVFLPKKLIIATGSKPRELPHLPFDEAFILSSDGILELDELPESIAIVGGGVIGSEWASLFNSFGVDVTLIEYTNHLLPDTSERISKTFQKAFEKKGIKVHTNCEVEKAEVFEGEVELTIKDGESITTEKVMVAVGRVPNIFEIGLMNTSIQFDEKGIKVNEYYQTAESHIYAIGDCIPTLQLAHVAAKEGELAVAHIVEEIVEPLDYAHVPRCTYASPEVATVGYTSNSLPKDKKVKIGTFAFSGNGKALIHGESTGFVEVIRDEETDDLLGVSIIGPHATELISEGALGLYLNATPLELGEAIHPHPSLTEAVMEAALDTYGLAVHK